MASRNVGLDPEISREYSSASAGSVIARGNSSRTLSPGSSAQEQHDEALLAAFPAPPSAASPSAPLPAHDSPEFDAMFRAAMERKARPQG